MKILTACSCSFFLVFASLEILMGNWLVRSANRWVLFHVAPLHIVVVGILLLAVLFGGLIAGAAARWNSARFVTAFRIFFIVIVIVGSSYYLTLGMYRNYVEAPPLRSDCALISCRLHQLLVHAEIRDLALGNLDGRFAEIMAIGNAPREKQFLGRVGYLDPEWKNRYVVMDSLEEARGEYSVAVEHATSLFKGMLSESWPREVCAAYLSDWELLNRNEKRERVALGDQLRDEYESVERAKAFNMLVQRSAPDLEIELDQYLVRKNAAGLPIYDSKKLNTDLASRRAQMAEKERKRNDYAR